MTGPHVVSDHNGDPVYARDVLPDDPLPTSHRGPYCWGCPNGCNSDRCGIRLCVRGCDDEATEGGLCVKCAGERFGEAR